MYFYILDPRNVPQKDFERQQAELQSLLTEFKINGEMTRITPLRIMEDLVDTAASRGVKTLVVCGTDDSFQQMLASLKDRDFTLAFVPFVPNTRLGTIFGMADIATCVKTIASRRIELIDVAKINERHFISYLEIGVAANMHKKLGFFSSLRAYSEEQFDVELRIDDSYTVNAKIVGGLLINARGSTACMGTVGNPQDGFLDLVMIEHLTKFEITRYKKELSNGCYEKIPGASAIRCKKVEFLKPATMHISIEGKEVAHPICVAEIANRKLKLIVGRTRTF